MSRPVKVASAADYFYRGLITSWMFNNVFDAIPFDRQAGGAEGLALCIGALSDNNGQGTGLVFYPEGTRSIDGRLQPFKVGIGVVAVETGVPVIPVWIDGTHALMPKGSSVPRAGKVRVVFGEPIQPTEVVDENRYAAYTETTRRVEAAVRELGGVELPDSVSAH
jgi:long-chain acyl-CoA synthetase